MWAKVKGQRIKSVGKRERESVSGKEKNEPKEERNHECLKVKETTF